MNSATSHIAMRERKPMHEGNLRTDFAEMTPGSQPLLGRCRGKSPLAGKGYTTALDHFPSSKEIQ